MNIVVISEGRTELGKTYLNRDFLCPVPTKELGALETITVRIAKEVFNQNLTIMGFGMLPHTGPGHVRTASLGQVIQDPELLKRILSPCFNPPRRELTANAIQGAIIACDETLHNTVSKSITQVRKSINNKVIHVTFKPEFEIVLLEREAIEQAANLKPNCIKIPDKNDIEVCGGLKEALVQCVIKSGYHDNPKAASSEFKLKVARCLSTAYLACDNSPISELRQHIFELFTK